MSDGGFEVDSDVSDCGIGSDYWSGGEVAVSVGRRSVVV